MILIKFEQGVVSALFLDHHRRIWASIHASIEWRNQEIPRVLDLGQKPPNPYGYDFKGENAQNACTTTL